MEQNYLFSNLKDPNLLRYFRLGGEWHESFVIEFTLGAEQYEHLYWGDFQYATEDRRIISEMLTIAFLPDSFDEWKKEKLERIGQTSIIELAENEINQKIK